MDLIPSIKLSEFFTALKPKYMLVTTYTLSLAFFESMVWHRIEKGELYRCLILCDQLGFRRAISEAGALQSAANSYMVVTAPGKYSFHPKVWLIAREDRAVLLCGSGNLTQSGFMDNPELFDVVQLSKEEDSDERSAVDRGQR